MIGLPQSRPHRHRVEQLLADLDRLHRGHLQGGDRGIAAEDLHPGVPRQQVALTVDRDQHGLLAERDAAGQLLVDDQAGGRLPGVGGVRGVADRPGQAHQRRAVGQVVGGTDDADRTAARPVPDRRLRHRTDLRGRLAEDQSGRGVVEGRVQPPVDEDVRGPGFPFEYQRVRLERGTPVGHQAVHADAGQHDGRDHGAAEDREAQAPHRQIVRLRVARQQRRDDASGDEPVRLNLIAAGPHALPPAGMWSATSRSEFRHGLPYDKGPSVGQRDCRPCIGGVRCRRPRGSREDAQR